MAPVAFPLAKHTTNSRDMILNKSHQPGTDCVNLDRLWHGSDMPYGPCISDL